MTIIIGIVSEYLLVHVSITALCCVLDSIHLYYFAVTDEPGRANIYFMNMIKSKLGIISQKKRVKKKHFPIINANHVRRVFFFTITKTFKTKHQPNENRYHLEREKSKRNIQ